MMEFIRRSGIGLWLAALAAVLAVTAQGCTGPTFVVQQYAGPPRPRETIAILRIDGKDPVRIVSVDGEPLAPVDDDVRLHVEVLPGEHSVGIANVDLPDQPAERVRFEAEPGKLYRAVMGGAGARVFEIDDAGSALRDASRGRSEPREAELSPAPAPAPAPAPVVAPIDAGIPSGDAAAPEAPAPDAARP